VTVDSTVVDKTIVDVTVLTAVASKVVGFVVVEVNIKQTISHGMVSTIAYKSGESSDSS